MIARTPLLSFHTFRYDSSFLFVIFLINFGIHILFTGFLFIGIFGAGGGGVITMLDMLS